MTTQRSPVTPAWITRRLLKLKSAGLQRHLTEIEARRPGEIRINGEWHLNLASNDYLGLAQHPLVVRSFCDSARKSGLGSTGSRLISGTHAAHTALERELALFKGTEAALFFPSGYHANLAVVTSLADRNTVVFSDAQNHASIVDGCRLTKATRIVYPHKDTTALRDAMEHHADVFERKLVVTDSVFSTDGSVAPLVEINRLCRRHNALLVIDEAHATGVLGPDGRGVAASLGVAPTVHVATASKALGCAGGFVACSETLKAFLLHVGRSFVYTTAPPPPLAEACRTALALASGPFGNQLRSRLLRNVALFKEGLRDSGWTVRSESHILAIPMEDPVRSMEAASWLENHNIFVKPFRPPTVPEGQSLLRIAPSAMHTEPQILRALQAFAQLLEDLAKPGLHREQN